MTTKEKYEKLRDLEMLSESDAELEKIHAELEQLADRDPEGFETAVLECAGKTLADAKVLKIKEQMVQISSMISMSYIAKHYFNKSKSWFSQRINEFDVNGKPAKFTPEELETLNFAIRDISEKLRMFRISC
ncbi:MAG: DUF5053 domain-containing protein [Culturomica sp.]|jgi:hypothetical protein|nr:DUF5053 domain-containing protein [Culturomica sp.]